MNRSESLTLMIVDDQFDVLEVYEDVLGGQLGHQVECVSMPGEALRHVRTRLFDIVIIDAKITYKGAPLGGLLLAEDIGAILGIGSVLLMSQYDVREEVRHFDPAFSFLPKPRSGADLLGWVEKHLMGKIRSLVRRQYGFVAMEYNNAESDDWYRTRLVPWMDEAGFRIRRMDEIPTTRAINYELLERIRQAHFVVLYAAKRNPNVFFEAGFARAHEKSIIVLSPDLEELPFDIRSNYAIPLRGPDEDAVRQRLLRLMCGLRGVGG